MRQTDGNRLRNASAALVSSLLAACSGLGGQTGDEHPDRDGLRCLEVSRRVIANDEQTPLGFSAGAVLEFALATHTAPLQWNTELPVVLGAEQATSSIELALSALGQAEYVDNHMEGTGPNDTGCGDVVEVPVLARVRSAGAALDESLETTLYLPSASYAELNPKLALDALSGTLGFDESDLDGATGELYTRSLVTRYGTAGSIDVQFENRDGKDVTGWGSRLATWPIDSSCDTASRTSFPVPYATILGSEPIATPAEALAILEALEPVNLTWLDGTSTTLTAAVVRAAASACAELDLDGGFGMSADVAVATADDRWNQTYAATLRVVSSTSESVQLAFSSPCAAGADGAVDSAATSCSALGVDVSAYEFAQLTFEATFAPGEPPRIDGALRVVGQRLAICAEERCDLETVELAVIWITSP